MNIEEKREIFKQAIREKRQLLVLEKRMRIGLL